MPLVSPRAGKITPLNEAASVPEEWDNDVEHRRKLAEAIRLIAGVLEGVINEGGFSGGFDDGFS